MKNIYGMMKKDVLEDYARLLLLECNSYLSKIYRSMKPKVPLAPQQISRDLLVFKNASPGATKAWEFRLNSRDDAARGKVGKIVVITSGLDNETVRKQRALFIAAEFYVYHAFANHPDVEYFNRIRSQNQYFDLIRKAFKADNAHDIRDRAIHYIIGEIKEHKLAHFRGNGWFTSMAKLDKHYPEIAATLGSSEKTFHSMFRMQNNKFSPDMLRQEDDLVRKEIEDLDHLSRELSDILKHNPKHELKEVMKLHLENLKTFKSILSTIISNLDKWVVVDKEEHAELKKRVLGMKDIKALLEAESEELEIDINKVHILFSHFKKEKINIVRDLEKFAIGAQVKK